MTDWLILNNLFHIDCLGFSVGRITFSFYLSQFNFFVYFMYLLLYVTT